MILAPYMKNCDLCGNVMYLRWTEDGITWIFVYDSAPVHDKIEMDLKCNTCGNSCNPYGETEEEQEAYNEIRFKIISMMVSKGLYQWRSDVL